jgi:hypothetical protein
MTRNRLGFLHVPKTAGMSLRQALGSTLDANDIAPWDLDSTVFGPFRNFESLWTPIRNRIFLGTPDALRGYRAIMGHFSLTLLQQVVDASDIAIFLREPRARLLSLYRYWRSWSEAEHQNWEPYRTSRLAVSHDMVTFLRAPQAAAATDNGLVRLLLAGDARIEPDTFIPPQYHADLAAEACSRLAGVGFVDLVERGHSAFDALGAWVGAQLDVPRKNVTPSSAEHPTDWDAVTSAEALELMNVRSAADLQVWKWAAGRVGLPGADLALASDAAWLRRVVHAVRQDAKSIAS